MRDFNQRRFRAIAFGLATVALGLGIRFVHVGLPWVVMKYGGSMLWAMMIYWIVSALLPAVSLSLAGLVTGAVAAAIEFFKLYHSPWLDAFRLTLPGVLLIGRFFSYWDILAYWFGILAAVVLDWRIRRRAA